MSDPLANDASARDAQQAAEFQADVGLQHIAAVYAKAFLGALEKTGQTAAVVAEFDEIIRGVIAPQPKFAAVLASELISQDEKTAVIDRVFSGRAAPVLVHFLKVLARHGRLGALQAVHRELHTLYDAMQGRVRVQLTTALPVDGALGERLAAQLRAALGAEPVVTLKTDPELIGGAVLRIGDTVYDGSIANQLNALRQKMIDRSAHEIQSRRDRFSYPAGN